MPLSPSQHRTDPAEESASAPTARRSSSMDRSPLGLLASEYGWLVWLGLLVFAGLALASHHPADPGWFTTGSSLLQAPHNWMGVLGAYVADGLLFVSGGQAWWLVVGLALLVVNGLRLRSEHLSPQEPLPRLLNYRPRWRRAPLPGAARVAGFVLLVVFGAVLEAMWGRSLGDLPTGALRGFDALWQQPGGLLGSLVGSTLEFALGPLGTTLLSITLLMVGLTLAFEIHLMELMEAVGSATERMARQSWGWLSGLRDRRLGASEAEVRATRVVDRRRELEAQPPIEPEAPAVVVPSARLEEEKREILQPALFKDLPTPTAAAGLPALSLLEPVGPQKEAISPETLAYTSRLIESRLADFGVQVKVVSAQPGPVITRYEIEPAVGVKGSQIVNLAKDLARALSLVSVRVVETIPGRNVMGLELPNPNRQTVRLSEILGSKAFQEHGGSLPIALGKDIAGGPVVVDLARMPHVLVAGTTGSGKSVGINAMLLSLLYHASAEHIRLIMIDPKMLELSVYEGIPHLLTPVVTDMKLAANSLHWAVGEMERRYRLMSKLGVRNLAGYNAKVEEAIRRGQPIADPLIPPEMVEAAGPPMLEPMPHIVIVIDELSDLMMVVGKKIEELIARLAQKARAAGIHLILATQRPSVDVITGLIKANIPARIAFQVSSKIDSRTILDQMGAEALLGMGDMLYMTAGSGVPTRVHGAFVADNEVNRICDSLRAMGPPNYDVSILEGADPEQAGGSGSAFMAGLEKPPGAEGGDESDGLYDQAVAVVLKHRRASISLVQRHLRIGYNRAARLLETMEQAGLVSAMQSNGNRDILVPPGAGDRHE